MILICRGDYSPFILSQESDKQPRQGNSDHVKPRGLSGYINNSVCVCVCVCLHVHVHIKQQFFYSSAKWHLTTFSGKREVKEDYSIPQQLNLLLYIPSIPKFRTAELQTSILNPSSI